MIERIEVRDMRSEVRGIGVKKHNGRNEKQGGNAQGLGRGSRGGAGMEWWVV